MPLTVISVHPKPVRPATDIYWAVPDLPKDPRDEEVELNALRQFVDKVASETGETVPGISLVVATGDPAEELINASRDADLLVVGSRGIGGFAKLLLDEPASALDPASTARIEDLIFELKRDYTIVIVTHNMQQATRVSDRTAFFYVLTDSKSDTRTGVLVEYGPTKQIFEDPQDPRTQNYVTGRVG